MIALSALMHPATALPEELPVLNKEITLDEALQSAFSQHPELHAAHSRISATQGALLRAQTYPYNPELSANTGARKELDNTTTDFSVALSQTIELPQMRRARIAQADAQLRATRAQYSRGTRLLAARVHTAFITALEARDLLGVVNADATLVTRIHVLMQKKLARGAATQLELNLAAAERGRAEGRLKTAEGRYLTARTALAESLGVSPLFPPTPHGPLAMTATPLPSLDELASTVHENRADLAAFRLFEQQAHAAHELAQASAWPRLTLRVFAGREAERDTIIGSGFSIPLPVFDRNQGERARTHARRKQARAQRAQAELLALQELASTHASYRAASEAAARLRSHVFGTLENNLPLLEKAYRAGKNTWSEVLVIRRSLIDAERELIAAEGTARRAWIALELAAGRLPIPAAQLQETTP